MFNRAELRRYILLIAGRMLKWSTVDTLSPKWGWLRATMPPVDQSEGEEVTTQPCRNMNAFGFRSAPVKGSEIIVAAPRAGATNAVVVASDSLGHGPTDLDEGDAVMYSSAHKEGASCVIKTDKDGAISVTAKTGQPITLQTSNGQIKIDGTGKITLDASGGASVAMDVSTLATTLLRATHFGGNTAAPPPTVAPGAALRGGAANISGTDAAFKLELTVAAPGGLAGILATVSFGVEYDVVPQFSITAADSIALIVAGVVPVGLGPVFAVATTTQLIISTGLPISTGPLNLSVMLRQ